jgi:hypothetical protein
MIQDIERTSKRIDRLIVALVVVLGINGLAAVLSYVHKLEYDEHCKLGLYTWDKEGGVWHRAEDQTRVKAKDGFQMMIPIKYMSDESFFDAWNNEMNEILVGWNKRQDLMYGFCKLGQIIGQGSSAWINETLCERCPNK